MGYTTLYEMPSRKKAKGKARKEAIALKAQHSFGCSTCNHFSLSPELIDVEDKIICMALASKYGDMTVELMRRKVTDDVHEQQAINDELFDITTDTYAEFRHFPDRRKEVFREILISKATHDILTQANSASDLVKESKKIAPPSHLIILLAHMKVMEKYSGEYNCGAVRGENHSVYNNCDAGF